VIDEVNILIVLISRVINVDTATNVPNVIFGAFISSPLLAQIVSKYAVLLRT